MGCGHSVLSTQSSVLAMTTGTAPPPRGHENSNPEPPPHPANTLLASFGYAFTGLAYCFRTQRNFRIHVAIGTAATLAGLLLRLSWVEWAVLAVTMALVLSAEMVNTMIESLVDLVTAEYHPLAKVAKDVAAGVVLLTAIGAVVVGLLIFGPRLVGLVLR
ncbi:MAG: diacylglycerol kinase family protein [Chloroflexia bacterium]